MKKIAYAMLVLVLLLSACGTEAAQSSGSQIEELNSKIQELNDAYTSLESDYTKLESDYTQLQSDYANLEEDHAHLESAYEELEAANAAPQDTPSTPQDNEPESDLKSQLSDLMPPQTSSGTENWEDSIPDGLDVAVEEFDEFTLLVRCTNNTGDSISLTVSYDFADDNQDEIIWGAGWVDYIADGSEYIFICDCPDPIYYYALEFEIGRVFQKVQEANDALSMESVRNDDDSVTVTFYTTAEDGASVEGHIFYLSDDGTVLGYDYCGLGFPDQMSNDFDAPGFDYADYIICYQALA